MRNFGEMPILLNVTPSTVSPHVDPYASLLANTKYYEAVRAHTVVVSLVDVYCLHKL